MLRFSDDVLGASVVDLSSGRQIAQVIDYLIDPDNLSVAALVCAARNSSGESFLLNQDIHGFNEGNITIQNDAALSDEQDVVRIQQLLKINFQLPGKKVKTDGGQRLGVVTQFVIEDKSLLVQKIYVRPPVAKLLTSSDLIISRSQVVEVNDREIIVRDSTVRRKALAGAVADA